MAWQDEMVPMLRVLINDMEEDAVYTDSRLEDMLIVSARLVEQEIDFSTSYTIVITDRGISPDPTVTATLDDAFTNFTVLKAACIADQSTFRTKALAAGIQAKCGPATLNTAGYLDGFKELLTIGPCAAYETMKTQWMFGKNITNIYRIILGPYGSNEVMPESIYLNRSTGSMFT